jgi:hypothetical protein
MKEGVTKVEMTHDGKTVDFTRTLNEVQNMESVNKEAAGQISSLILEWSPEWYKAMKINGNELALNLSVKLKGDSGGIKVKSSISFIASKMTDEREAYLSFSQNPLPYEDKRA